MHWTQIILKTGDVRPFLHAIAAAALLCSMPICFAAEPLTTEPAQTPLQTILAGNQRFANNHALHPHQSSDWAHSLSHEQHPLVAILTCSDSRITPEVIFDQGLGDIFDVRVAGNIVDAAVLGSLEYAVAHLHVPLIVVLGHQHCGAVEAAIHQEHPHNHINTIIRALAPAVKHANGSVETAVQQNVALTLHKLQHAPVLQDKLQSGQLQIVGGYYNLETGLVELSAF